MPGPLKLEPLRFTAWFKLNHLAYLHYREVHEALAAQGFEHTFDDEEPFGCCFKSDHQELGDAQSALVDAMVSVRNLGWSVQSYRIVAVLEEQ